jgi:hypothetical protein
VFFEHPTQAWALGEVVAGEDEKKNVQVRFYNENKKKETMSVPASKCHIVVDVKLYIYI